MHSLEMSNPREDIHTQVSKTRSEPLPKKKLKLSGAVARDKLMAMRDSDISSLNTESDSQSLISSQE